MSIESLMCHSRPFIGEMPDDKILFDKYGIMINLYGKFKFLMNNLNCAEFIDFIAVTNFFDL